MILTLNPVDLKPEFQRGGNQAINDREVTFEHLNPAAQNAVRAVGQAMFYGWSQTCKAIYPPKPQS